MKHAFLTHDRFEFIFWKYIHKIICKDGNMSDLYFYTLLALGREADGAWNWNRTNKKMTITYLTERGPLLVQQTKTKDSSTRGLDDVWCLIIMSIAKCRYYMCMCICMRSRWV